MILIKTVLDFKEIFHPGTMTKDYVMVIRLYHGSAQPQLHSIFRNSFSLNDIYLSISYKHIDVLYKCKHIDICIHHVLCREHIHTLQMKTNGK
jgi:hypothetical protein